LNKYLHQFGKRYSPYCSCGYAKETMEYFILECPNYKAQRKELRKRVGAYNTDQIYDGICQVNEKDGQLAKYGNDSLEQRT
jgi:hypothetical protein